MATQRKVVDVVADTSTDPTPTEAVAPVETGVGDSPAAEYIDDTSRGTHYAPGYEPAEDTAS